MAWMFAYDDNGEYINHKGDSGGMSLFMSLNEDNTLNQEQGPPKIGGVMRVGSTYARTFSVQDWWQTSLIEKILEDYIDDDGVHNVKFQTRNSKYHWKER